MNNDFDWKFLIIVVVGYTVSVLHFAGAGGR